MKILVTGCGGHLGEALMRFLPTCGHEPVGLDVRDGPFTQFVGSITDAALLQSALRGVDAVAHAAALHKPHVVTHSEQKFIETNILGTLTLLQACVTAEVERIAFASTTSTFGDALRPTPGAPAAWIDESVTPSPKNIYGVTKTAAEDLCALFARNHSLSCAVLRLSRFFPEEDDDKARRDAFSSVNAKANEFLYRRVDIEDAAKAVERALAAASPGRFARYVISAPTPLTPDDLATLRAAPAQAIAARVPMFEAVYAAAGYRMFSEIDRIYDSSKAVRELDWRPTYSFERILQQIGADEEIGSALSREVGVKGYHACSFAEGPYPVSG
ncbi:MAG: NAD(P)-dependent oxidoreductase [Rhodobacteraceae bacterium]|nr:NAD(P)-dependent oxidoreductase [Paracoccaceae bacterium]